MKIYMELRACAGGKESALFADELLAMYLKYAKKNNISTEILSEDKTVIVSFDGKP